MKNTKFKLIIMNFLEFAIWGAYLTSQGRYLASVGLADNIGWFYSVQGIVSFFMPALMGILADKWDAKKVLSLCHFLAGIAMIATGMYGLNAGSNVQFGTLFTLYTISVAFFMPTIALSYSVAYSVLEKAGMDTVTSFPPIRIWGTIGFIIMMWSVDLAGFQATSAQYAVSGALSIVLALYALSLPSCKVEKNIEKNESKKSIADAMGLKAFSLFKEKQMAVFFIFAFLLGAALQISNGFANPFLGDFEGVTAYANTFGVQHSNILVSLSQISETLCILMIPFFLKKFGIKRVVLLAMFAWSLRFLFLGLGNPGEGVWLFILSMIVYGMAFDFFNISGSLFVDKNTSKEMRSSAQGLFMLMTNGLGAAIGSILAQALVTNFTSGLTGTEKMAGWSTAWFVFAAYAAIVGILFAIFFNYKHKKEGA